jgi:regulator of chromosome condensation
MDVNDNGAPGRDTTWEAPTIDFDHESNSEESDDEGDLSAPQSKPTAILRENFGKVVPTFV